MTVLLCHAQEFMQTAQNSETLTVIVYFLNSVNLRMSMSSVSINELFGVNFCWQILLINCVN